MHQDSYGLYFFLNPTGSLEEINIISVSVAGKCILHHASTRHCSRGRLSEEQDEGVFDGTGLCVIWLNILHFYCMEMEVLAIKR